jgi:hypothetical protein
MSGIFAIFQKCYSFIPRYLAELLKLFRGTLVGKHWPIAWNQEMMLRIPPASILHPKATPTSTSFSLRLQNCVPDCWWSTTCLVESQLNIHLLLRLATQPQKVAKYLHAKRTLHELADGQTHWKIPIHLNFSVQTFNFFAIYHRTIDVSGRSFQDRTWNWVRTLIQATSPDLYVTSH